jgi:hypothetical protein
LTKLIHEIDSKAEYCMERVTSRGVTGGKAKFVIDLPKHNLSFATKIQENLDSLETNLPSEASIDLPQVHVSAEYIQVLNKAQCRNVPTMYVFMIPNVLRAGD